MNRTYKGMIYVVLSAIGFALMPIFARLAYAGGINVTSLLLIRFALASIFFFGYIFIKYGSVSVGKQDLLALFILGGLCYTIQSNLYFLSVKYISIALAVLILYTYPAVVALISIIFFKEKVNSRILISILISFLGVALILGTSLGAMNIKGIILAAAASVVYSCYVIYGNRIVKGVQPVVTSAFVTLFAAFGLLVIGLATGEISFVFESRTWLYIIALVLISTVLSIFTFFIGMELVGATKASIISITEPLFAIVFSAVFFDERITAIQLAGGLAVIIGAVIVTIGKGK